MRRRQGRLYRRIPRFKLTARVAWLRRSCTGRPCRELDRITAAAPRRWLLSAASDDDEGVTFGDDVKTSRVMARAGRGVVMVSRPSSCCRGVAGVAAPPLGAGQPPRTGARSCPRAIIAMICHGGAVGPSLRTEAAAAVARADMASPL